MSLDNLARIGQFKTRTPSASETLRLLASAERNLKDAHVAGISDETRFDVGYKAIMQCALVALMASGYRPATILRDDGMSYGDYVEQLTYLLFLKMADERSRPPYNQASLIPEFYAWPAPLKRDGDDQFDHYRHTLEILGVGKGKRVLPMGDEHGLAAAR